MINLIRIRFSLRQDTKSKAKKDKGGSAAEKVVKRKRPEEEDEEGSTKNVQPVDEKSAATLENEEDELDEEDDDEGDGKDNRTKKSKRDADLCPAAGPGSCVIHDITPAGQTEGRKACRHHIAVPPGQDVEVLRAPPPARIPAKEYKFELDPFQRAAVNCLEKNQSVLVSAHTSAGKTAVAECKLRIQSCDVIDYNHADSAILRHKVLHVINRLRSSDRHLMTRAVRSHRNSWHFI